MKNSLVYVYYSWAGDYTSTEYWELIRVESQDGKNVLWEKRDFIPDLEDLAYDSL